MSFRVKGHRIWAILVLIAASAWVATGHFASVGSEEAHAAQPAAEAEGEAPAQTVAPLRTVAVMTPDEVSHAREIRVSGVTSPDKRSVLAARSNGIISSLSMTEGDSVAANAIVMTIEGDETAAAVLTAEAQLRQRAQELEVAEKLFKSGNTAELQLIKVRAEKAAAESALSQAQAAADRLNLRAPFSGIIDSVDGEIGQWVQAGTEIATLLSLDPIVVRVEVSEIDVGFVQVGDRASVRLMNDTTIEGKVRHIAREATAQTRTYPVEVEIANPDGKLPSGMTAEVSLYTKPELAVTVPRSVITLSSEGEIGIRVVNAENVAEFASIELIDDTPDGLVIKGVPKGSRIIVAGQDLVSDGEKVEVTDATEVVKDLTNTTVGN